MSHPRTRRGNGVPPFTVFGLAVILAGAFALYMGLAYTGTPTFDSAALPTVGGTMVAVAAFLLIGSRAPPNE